MILVLSEDQRIDRLLALELKGMPLPCPPPRKNVCYGVALPIKPFRLWVEHLIAIEEHAAHVTYSEAQRRVAERLDVKERRVRCWLREWSEVDEAVVDRACTREGSVHVGDLYPDYWERMS